MFNIYVKILKTHVQYFLLRNVQLTSTLVNGIDSAIILCTEILVILGISALLLITRPLEGFTVIILLSLSGYIVHFFSKKHLTRWGEQRHFHDGQRIKHLQQGFNALKDLKM